VFGSNAHGTPGSCSGDISKMNLKDQGLEQIVVSKTASIAWKELVLCAKEEWKKQL
jgi:hypothetical protein